MTVSLKMVSCATLFGLSVVFVSTPFEVAVDGFDAVTQGLCSPPSGLPVMEVLFVLRAPTSVSSASFRSGFCLTASSGSRYRTFHDAKLIFHTHNLIFEGEAY